MAPARVVVCTAPLMAGRTRVFSELGRPAGIWATTLIATPLLFFPTVAPRATLLAVALAATSWAMSIRNGARAWLPEPVGFPAALLFLLVGVAALISPAPAVTMSKVAGLLLGLLVLRAMTAGVETPRAYERAALVGVALATGLVIFGALTTTWERKFDLLAALIRRLPRAVVSLPGAEQGANANALAGTILLALPLVLAAAWSRWPTVVLGRQSRRGGGGIVTRMRVLAVLISVAMLTLFVATQSRGAWAAAGGTLVLIIVCARLPARAWGWLLPGAAAIGLSATLLLGQTEPISTESDQMTRVALWTRALDAIGDAPLTGVGLGAFRAIVPVLYPIPGLPASFDVSHAHNIFLQVALDLGVLGLGVYLWFLATVLATAGRVWRTARADDSRRVWMVAAVASIVAVHAFGLLDAIALGAKVGVLFWWACGLVMAAAQLEHPSGRVAL